jgi:hypothetical protein
LPPGSDRTAHAAARIPPRAVLAGRQASHGSSAASAASREGSPSAGAARQAGPGRVASNRAACQGASRTRSSAGPPRRNTGARPLGLMAAAGAFGPRAKRCIHAHAATQPAHSPTPDGNDVTLQK